jgi:hypothetical protein
MSNVRALDIGTCRIGGGVMGLLAHRNPDPPAVASTGSDADGEPFLEDREETWERRDRLALNLVSQWARHGTLRALTGAGVADSPALLHVVSVAKECAARLERLDCGEPLSTVAHLLARGPSGSALTELSCRIPRDAPLGGLGGANSLPHALGPNLVLNRMVAADLPRLQSLTLEFPHTATAHDVAAALNPIIKQLVRLDLLVGACAGAGGGFWEALSGPNHLIPFPLARLRAFGWTIKECTDADAGRRADDEDLDLNRTEPTAHLLAQLALAAPQLECLTLPFPAPQSLDRPSSPSFSAVSNAFRLVAASCRVRSLTFVGAVPGGGDAVEFSHSDDIPRFIEMIVATVTAAMPRLRSLILYGEEDRPVEESPSPRPFDELQVRDGSPLVEFTTGHGLRQLLVASAPALDQWAVVQALLSGPFPRLRRVSSAMPDRSC